jgi:hypothetical protein
MGVRYRYLVDEILPLEEKGNEHNWNRMDSNRLIRDIECFADHCTVNLVLGRKKYDCKSQAGKMRRN